MQYLIEIFAENETQVFESIVGKNNCFLVENIWKRHFKNFSPIETWKENRNSVYEKKIRISVKFKLVFFLFFLSHADDHKYHGDDRDHQHILNVYFVKKNFIRFFIIIFVQRKNF